MMQEVELCFPQLNTSCMKPKRRLSDTVFIYIVLSSVSLLTATLNLLVIISISHFKQLHTPTNLLILSLAVSDFFVSFLLLFQIMIIDGCWYLSDIMCLFYCVLAYIITSSSIETMVLISVDRYVAICHPLRYSTKVTPKRVKICVSVCWFFSLSCFTLLLKDNLNQPGRYNSCVGECVIVLNIFEQYTDLILTFIIPITLIIVLYIRVFVVAVSQAHAMRSHIAAITLKHSVSVTAKKSELKAARTLGVVIVVFILCICPYFFTTLMGKLTLVNTSSEAFVICLLYVNSCLNPIIYALFYPWFRKSVKLVVTLQILKPGSSQTNIL
uniref:G-protein coupled receptors family 1 profile domain-containing protein n=1 Tax=Monopterus albus TaxID=43700 RepID=A0A3Q3QM27_MONAL